MSETAPDTLSYLFLGLGAIIVIMGLLIGSMFARWQSFQRDLQVIEQLQDED